MTDLIFNHLSHLDVYILILTKLRVSSSFLLLWIATDTSRFPFVCLSTTWVNFLGLEAARILEVAFEFVLLFVSSTFVSASWMFFCMWLNLGPIIVVISCCLESSSFRLTCWQPFTLGFVDLHCSFSVVFWCVLRVFWDSGDGSHHRCVIVSTRPWDCFNFINSIKSCFISSVAFNLKPDNGGVLR